MSIHQPNQKPQTVTVEQLKQFSEEFGPNAIPYLIAGLSLEQARQCAKRDNGDSSHFQMTQRENIAYKLAAATQAENHRPVSSPVPLRNGNLIYPRDPNALRG